MLQNKTRISEHVCTVQVLLILSLITSLLILLCGSVIFFQNSVVLWTLRYEISLSSIPLTALRKKCQMCRLNLILSSQLVALFL